MELTSRKQKVIIVKTNYPPVYPQIIYYRVTIQVQWISMCVGVTRDYIYYACCWWMTELLGFLIARILSLDMNPIKKSLIVTLARYMQAVFRCLTCTVLKLIVIVVQSTIFEWRLIIFKMLRDLYRLYSSNKVIIFVKPVQERGASTGGSVNSNELVLPRRTSLSVHDDYPFETQSLLVSERESSRSEFVIGRFKSVMESIGTT